MVWSISLLFFLPMALFLLACNSADKKETAGKKTKPNTAEATQLESSVPEKPNQQQISKLKEMVASQLALSEKKQEKVARSLVAIERQIKTAKEKMQEQGWVASENDDLLSGNKREQNGFSQFDAKFQALSIQQAQAKTLYQESENIYSSDSSDGLPLALEKATQSEQLAQIVLEQSGFVQKDLAAWLTAQKKNREPKIHVVESRQPVTDCLWNIAKKYYGKGRYWRVVYRENMKKIRDPNLVRPGLKLTIPYIPEAHEKWTNLAPKLSHPSATDSSLPENLQRKTPATIQKTPPSTQKSTNTKSDTILEPQEPENVEPITPSDEDLQDKKSPSPPSSSIPVKKSRYGNNSSDRDEVGSKEYGSRQEERNDGKEIRNQKNNPDEDEGQIEFRVDENRLILPRNRVEEDPLLLELEKNVDQYLLEVD